MLVGFFGSEDHTGAPYLTGGAGWNSGHEEGRLGQLGQLDTTSQARGKLSECGCRCCLVLSKRSKGVCDASLTFYLYFNHAQFDSEVQTLFHVPHLLGSMLAPAERLLSGVSSSLSSWPSWSLSACHGQATHGGQATHSDP